MRTISVQDVSVLLSQKLVSLYISFYFDFVFSVCIGECLDSLYIMAFTSGIANANSDTRHSVTITVAGETRVSLLPDLPQDDYQSLKGDLWKISFADDFSFDYCVRKNDIESIAIAESGNDGWNIETIVTFIESDNNFELASEDFNVFRWIDGDSESSRTYFELNLIL